ncbi:hypothetical protein A33Q_0133 [Indibacter alkaliphilus LW1]|uniref:DNA polymerase-3 subunit gamma/tau n=1 Tax=Indibacter alkaliphilus (strain CCUG 57479 / KCTC 22604 / LW1) TaxID=1189612 RepID=S2E6L2_INDAL|nr:hypothetical protein [Indibacter alkaliphilus]EPA00262.1 hypothetical protein A33Q_0133 [Indibacter alkaliphilus LW1]
MKNALFELADSFRIQNRSLESTILKQPFRLGESKITFKLIGEIQEDIFQKIRPEVLKLLRSKLNNDSVQIDFEITEETEDPSVRKLYTNTDKLMFLLEKSPALKELQKRFGLETDF